MACPRLILKARHRRVKQLDRLKHCRVSRPRPQLSVAVQPPRQRRRAIEQLGGHDSYPVSSAARCSQKEPDIVGERVRRGDLALSGQRLLGVDPIRPATASRSQCCRLQSCVALWSSSPLVGVVCPRGRCSAVGRSPLEMDVWNTFGERSGSAQAARTSHWSFTGQGQGSASWTPRTIRRTAGAWPTLIAVRSRFEKTYAAAVVSSAVMAGWRRRRPRQRCRVGPMAPTGIRSVVLIRV